MRVRDTARTVKFTFQGLFSFEAQVQDVARCPFVQGLLEIAAASNHASPCLPMPAVQQRCLRAWLAAVSADTNRMLRADAGTVAKWIQVRGITTRSWSVSWLLSQSQGK